MRESTVKILDDKDMEFVETLRSLGVPRNVATLITFLANVDEASSREIEMGSDLRQPEVSIALKYMTEQGWVTSSKLTPERTGRPMREITLARPIRQILASIEKATKEKADSQVALVRKMRSFA